MLHYPNQAKPEIVRDAYSKIYREHNALSHDLCNSIIEYGKHTVHKSENKYPELFDISFDASLLPLDHPVHEALQGAWNRAIDHIGFAIDYIEPYEIKRYTSKDFFGLHTDHYYGLEAKIDRKITMSIQLNDRSEYVGGFLTVAKHAFKNLKGSIIAFPSFFPHEVSPIVSGERWSLIGWGWGPYWR